MRKSLKQGTWWKQTQVLTTIIIGLKAKTAEFRRESNMAVRNSWNKKTAQLNLERDEQKLWRLVKSLNHVIVAADQRFYRYLKITQLSIFAFTVHLAA